MMNEITELSSEYQLIYVCIREFILYPFYELMVMLLLEYEESFIIIQITLSLSLIKNLI